MLINSLLPVSSLSQQHHVILVIPQAQHRTDMRLCVRAHACARV
jgi:hypothetical protein